MQLFSDNPFYLKKGFFNLELCDSGGFLALVEVIFAGFGG
jgi:hypothetical protein